MKHLALAIGTLLLLAACTPGAPAPPTPAGTSPTPVDTAPTPAGASPTPASERVTVVATTTVLADMVRQVAGERAEVHALVPRGADVHTFDPAPSDAVHVSRARLLVMNGLALDDWLRRFVEQAGAGDTPIVELAEDLPGVDYLESGDHHHEDEGRHEEDDDHDDDEHGGESEAHEDEVDHAYNPHLWMNVAYARLYVARLADELSEVDPAGEADYRANAVAYDARLAELDEWIHQQLATIPATDRRVVSFHDAFPYFAAAYDLEIVGVLVEAPGREPSAGEVARLIEAIRASGVRLILAESQFSDRLAQTVAAETGARVINDLYTDSLGAPPADTFADAMRWNVEQIVEELR